MPLVIILPQTVAKLFDSMLTSPVLRALCSSLLHYILQYTGVASDAAVENVYVDIRVKFGYFR